MLFSYKSVQRYLLFAVISPLNFKTLVSLNQINLFKEYLFIEEPDLLSLKNRNRNNGLIIAGNRNNRIEKKLSGSAHQLTKSERSITLSRVKNYEGTSSRNKSSLLYALDKMNFIDQNESIADLAIWPFVRQYRNIDTSSFEHDPRLTNIRYWLDYYLNNSYFPLLMRKINPWLSSHEDEIYPKEI